MRRAAILLFLVLAPGLCSGGEGMWPPWLIRQQEQRMKALGLKLSAEDLFSPTGTSLKDAVVLFGGGCTGEVVSDRGLVLTNHHCGYSSIQHHSTVDNDYLTRGYWARQPADELPCPGLTVTFVISSSDVTEFVLRGVTDATGPEERTRLVGERSKMLADSVVVGTRYRAEVSPFYNDNRYVLFILEEFNDIRLVGAPPSSIGNFGGDTDNWMWPRHTGDFSVFRIYADSANHPAPYAVTNVPYKPRVHFPVSLRGVGENDFAMVYGFPGRTQEYLSSAALEWIAQEIDPARIRVRDARLRIMEEGMRLSDTVRLKYAAKQKSISNAYKKWQGEVKGLARVDAVGTRRTFERKYVDAMQAAGRADLADAVRELETAYAQAGPYYLAYTYYQEAVGGIELLGLARAFRSLAAIGPDSAGGAASRAERDKLAETVRGFFKGYDARIDRRVFDALIGLYIANVKPGFWPPDWKMEREHQGRHGPWADDLYGRSVFADESRLLGLLAGDSPRMRKTLFHDPLYRLADALAAVYEDSIRPPLLMAFRGIRDLDRRYMEGQMRMEGRVEYPDANSTLRLAYGQVKGYTPRDAVRYGWQTTLTGVMEKEDPADEEFIVDDKLKELYRNSDFGPYGSGGTLPVAFVTTSHTTGGNSGSPVLDGEGRLVGINFDRVWEGTMSDLAFDPDRCRNIAVDIRYVLFVIDKVAGCHRLLDEMSLVR